MEAFKTYLYYLYYKYTVLFFWQQIILSLSHLSTQDKKLDVIFDMFHDFFSYSNLSIVRLLFKIKIFLV